MMSRCLSWSQKVCHEVNNTSWREKSKYVKKSQNALWRQKEVMTSIRSSLCQKHIMTSKSSLVMVSKTCYDDKEFVFSSKISSWHVMTSKVCHEVKSLSWSQKLSWSKKICYDVNAIKNVSWRKEHTMTLKSSWRHDVQKYVMPKPSITHDVQNISWRQKVRQKYVRTSERSCLIASIIINIRYTLRGPMGLCSHSGLYQLRWIFYMSPIW